MGQRLPASGRVELSLIQPSSSRYWKVRRLAVWGKLPSCPAAKALPAPAAASAAIFSSVLRVLALEDCRQLFLAVIGTSSLYRWNAVRARPPASGPATGIIALSA